MAEHAADQERIIELEKRHAGALSIEELESGLRLLGNDHCDHDIAGFRRTVLFAIRETSEALLSPAMSREWRLLLERQLETLVEYIELADRCLALRSLSRECESRPSSRRLH